MRILFVDIDTLRPDHLGCYGYPRRTSPNIDALAAKGVQFTKVYASDVPCLPSRTALITGMFGIRNGVVNHGGLTADLRPWGKDRPFRSRLAARSLAGALLSADYHTTSISSFPLRHSAPWWTSGFLESINLTRGMGGERADEVLPGALDWLDRYGRMDRWFLHVHFWDPHTPYNVPEPYGNPFEQDPIPEWHTEEVRQRNWLLPGPHSAQEPWGFAPDEWGPPPPRQPWNLASGDDVKKMFDGYDVGIRYADDAVGTLCSKLDDLGVIDDTLIWISSDHGEAFGELGVYADHQAADETTTHIPSILSGAYLPSHVQNGLLYHLDIATSVVELAGARVPYHWDGRSGAEELRKGHPIAGRDYLVTSQGAWSCQRGVRFDRFLYLETWHDGFHAAWAREMLFDVEADPHEESDRAGEDENTTGRARELLASWVEEQLKRSLSPDDPLEITLREGGPYHVRGRLEEYCQRLRSTGRHEWAKVLLERHGSSPSASHDAPPR